ncbi:MAG: AAA family ATPase, partial [Deltaproteobacteria bacterium]|nr:AAA family ATPase [Deltaproteobacteria bacterium]
MLKLPSNGQNFAKIRRDDLLYVDKTKYIYPIVKKGGCYFISRPRRFGKSLLIGTLENLLKGNRELFQGLWIDSSDYDFQKYPVVKLSVSGDCDSEAALVGSLINKLQGAAEENGLSLADLDLAENSSPGGILDRLVRKLCSREKNLVAILIDEYDAPINDVLGDPAQAEINRKVLRRFYASIKTLADDDKTSLIFVTGVTKFSKASVFSGFNNLSDLTLDPTHNSICGFTLEEFRSYFLEYLPDILEYNKSKGFMPPEADLDYLIGEIIGYYDGYSWDGETRVLNPYSLIQALATKELTAHWFSSGAMSFLIDLLKKGGSSYSFPETTQMSETSLNALDIKNLQLTPLLFQTGYLTIDQRLSADSYLLRRPNQEVSQALDQNLLDYLL